MRGPMQPLGPRLKILCDGFNPRKTKNLGYSMKSMILGVMSDVHANIHALKAAWAAFQARGVTHTICLGDLVGYGASPLEVISFMRENNIPTTLGASDANMDEGQMRVEANISISMTDIFGTKVE